MTLHDLSHSVVAGSDPTPPCTDSIVQDASSSESGNSGIRIALLVHDLRGGGAERVTVSLANGFASYSFIVDLVMINKVGNESYFDALSPDVNVVELEQSRTLTSPIGFWRYLNAKRPRIIISAMTHINVASIIANLASFRRTDLIVVEHNQLSRNRNSKSGLVRFAYHLVPWLYRYATIVGAVSEGVKSDLAETAKFPIDRIRVLHNPVVTPELLEQSQQPLEHPWFVDGAPPVILGVGRLTTQKSFDMLIDAFAAVRSKVPARLVILGDGPDREALEMRAMSSGRGEDIELIGFVSNPFAYMRRAAVFALSSRWEGLPTVLIEAMACSLPVVATDCPSGPAEILRKGELGRLTPVGDVAAFADALLETLERPPARESLEDRASDFNVDNAVARYLSTVRLVNSPVVLG